MTTSEGTGRVISLSQPPGVYSDKYFRTHNLRLEQLLRESFLKIETLTADLAALALIVGTDTSPAPSEFFGGNYFGRRYFPMAYFG